MIKKVHPFKINFSKTEVLNFNTRILFITARILFIGLIFIAASCTESKNPEPKQKIKNTKESLIRVNKNLVSSEDQKIEAFIQRHHWDMSKTGTGLRYLIYKEGKGAQILKGSQVELAYTVSLLNGDTIYTSHERGNLTFIPGKSDIANGLEEGILLLKKESKAKFILPSHLAFGLLGDMDKIPSKATLVYDIEVIQTK